MQKLSVNKWSLQNEEVAFFVGPYDTLSTNQSFNVYIPKLMPLIKKDLAKDIKQPVYNCFANSSECQVKINPSITIQNYLTVNTQNNITFKFPILKVYSKLIIKAISDNINRIVITNFSDNTTY